MTLDRRRFLLISSVSAAAGAVGLAGCNASASPSAEPSAPAASSAAAAAFPVSFTHRYGETTVEAAPTRIVCVGLKEQDDLLALGIVPVAATKWLELPDGNGIIGPWATAALGSNPAPERLEFTNGIDFEKVASLAPDLVLALYSGITQEDYDKLAQIAPTVAAPKEYVDYGIPWDVEADIVGRAVGRGEEMAALVTASKKAVTDAAAANPSFAGQTSMVATPYQGIYVYGAQDPRTRLMLDLGFVLPDGFDDLFPDDSSTFGGNISAEKAEILDVDALICFADEAGQKEIETRLFRSEDVSTEGRTVWMRTTDTATDPFSFLTVLSLPYLLEAFVPRVVAAVDGDPATSTEQQA